MNLSQTSRFPSISNIFEAFFDNSTSNRPSSFTYKIAVNKCGIIVSINLNMRLQSF